jgi:hypothetical protein
MSLIKIFSQILSGKLFIPVCLKIAVQKEIYGVRRGADKATGREVCQAEVLAMSVPCLI